MRSGMANLRCEWRCKLRRDEFLGSCQRGCLDLGVFSIIHSCCGRGMESESDFSNGELHCKWMSLMFENHNGRVEAVGFHAWNNLLDMEGWANIIEVYCSSYDIVWTDATTKRMEKQKCPKNIRSVITHRSVGTRPSKNKYSSTESGTWLTTLWKKA